MAINLSAARIALLNGYLINNGSNGSIALAANGHSLNFSANGQLICKAMQFKSNLALSNAIRQWAI